MKLAKNVDEYLNERANLLAQGIATDFICGSIEKFEELEESENPIYSPVEQLFWIEWQFRRASSSEHYLDFDSKFELFPQVKNEFTGKYILDFQVDFFASIMNSHDSKYFGYEKIISEKVEMQLLGIEIDGHIWHEKTKEQVRRDKERERFLVSQGWKLLRFTGSEVFVDVHKSVEETLGIAYNISNQYKKLVDKFLQDQKGNE